MVEELISCEDAESCDAAAETDSAERRTLVAMSDSEMMSVLASCASKPISSSRCMFARTTRSP